MAEVAVSVVLDRLISVLGAEVNLLAGLKKEVEDIRVELEYIACFLREADSRADKEESNSGLSLWVREVREVAYQMEDVMDEYMLHVEQYQVQQQNTGMKASLGKISHLVKNSKKCHGMASKIKDIKASVLKIKERSERYGFNSIRQRGRDGGNTRSDPRMGLHFVENDALVGIDSSREELASRLQDGIPTRTIVSLVGMGGVGKTTLAKKILDDQIMAGHFDCHAWITVSQSYKVEMLLKSMMKQMYESRKESPPMGLGKMDGVELISRFREYLNDKRYIVVFDDVWKEDFWRDMEYALLDNNKGSKILMTTRSVNIAEFCKKSSLVHVHNLEPLPPEPAQELLCRVAFRFDHDKQCPEELKDTSFNLVKRCEGLPLAIVALGGLLATKGKDVFHWKHLLDRLTTELDGNPHLAHIKKILSFGYHDLPWYLKGCFLYLGIFPEDYSINCKRLARTWIANGLVRSEERGMTLEEVATKYLTELINRRLVQVSYLDTVGNVRNCRLHDLMHEVILSKAKEMSFIRTSPENLMKHNGAVRHLSICNKTNDYFSVISGNYQTRSVIFFDIAELPRSLMISLFTKFKLLNELDFERAPLSYLPEELGNLLHLRYLSIRDTKVKKLPKSIHKLQKLQTLDLKRSLVCELPVEINMLCNLRYLVCYYKNVQSSYSIATRRGMQLHGNFGCLESLEKLYEVDMEAYNGATGNFFCELGRLKQLRKLCITRLKSECGRDLCDALEQMLHLQSLRISSMKEEELLQIHTLLSPPLCLRYLRLRGRLMKLPGWISHQLRNLTKVTLEWSRISDDSLEILGVLPELLCLFLYEAYDGVQLHFNRNHFRKLKELGLRGLYELKRLILDEGALTQLEQLTLEPSFQLEQFPSRICDLKDLKTLILIDLPKEFARKLLPDGGSDHWKVKHIPNIYFLYYTVKGTKCETYKLGDSRLLDFLR